MDMIRIKFIVLFLMVILVACSQPEFITEKNKSDGDTGTILLTLDTKSARSLLVNLDQSTDNFLIVGFGPDETSFNINTDDNSLHIDELAIGQWVINCYAVNKEGKTIGQGTTEIIIRPESIESISVVIEPLKGSGTLSCTIFFDENIELTIPVTAFLHSFSGVILPLNFDNTTDTSDDRISTIMTDIPAGYYILHGELKTGNKQNAGFCEYIRIREDENFDVVITVKENEEQLIIPELSGNSDILQAGTIAITGARETIDYEESLVLIASNPDIEDYTYMWFVNGDFFGDEKYISLYGLETGDYLVKLLVYNTSGTFIDSTSYQFNIKESDGLFHKIIGNAIIPDNCSNRKWYIAIDDDNDFKNGVVSVDYGVISGDNGDSFSFTLSGIGSGSYIIYAIVENNGIPGINEGDFYFINQNAEITETITFDIELDIMVNEFDFSGVYSYISTIEESGEVERGIAYLMQVGNKVFGEIELLNKNEPKILSFDGVIDWYAFEGMLTLPDDDTGYSVIHGNYKNDIITGILENMGEWGRESGTFSMEPIQSQYGSYKIINSFPVPGNSICHGLAYDGDGIWINSRDAKKVIKINSQGEILISFDSPGPSPTGLTFDGEYLWYTDDNTLIIYQLDFEGNIISMFDAPGNDSTGLTFDGEFLYNGDFSGQGRIHKLTKDGTLIMSYKSPFNGPEGLAYDGEFFFHTDYYENKIYKIHPSMNVVSLYHAPGTHPTGLAYDGNFLWMADEKVGMIYQLLLDVTSDEPWYQIPDAQKPVLPEGYRLLVANNNASPGDPGILSIDRYGNVQEIGKGFNSPTSLSVNPVTGDLFISDIKNNLYCVDQSGDVDLISVVPIIPKSIVFDKKGNIVVANTKNEIITFKKDDKTYRILASGFCDIRSLSLSGDDLYVVDCLNGIFKLENIVNASHTMEDPGDYFVNPGKIPGKIIDLEIGADKTLYAALQNGRVLSYASDEPGEENTILFDMPGLKLWALTLSSDEKKIFVTCNNENLVLQINLTSPEYSIVTDRNSSYGLVSGPSGILITNANIPEFTYNVNAELEIQGIYSLYYNDRVETVTLDNHKWYRDYTGVLGEEFSYEADIIYFDNINDYFIIKYVNHPKYATYSQKIVWKKMDSNTVKLMVYSIHENYEDALYSDFLEYGVQYLIDMNFVMLGDWNLDGYTLKLDNGRYTLDSTLDESGDVSGTYYIEKDTLHFDTHKSPCAFTTGIYRYSFDVGLQNLSVVPINDECKIRAAGLFGTWSRIGPAPTPSPSYNPYLNTYLIYTGEKFLTETSLDCLPPYQLPLYKSGDSADELEISSYGAVITSEKFLVRDFEIKDKGSYKLLICMNYLGQPETNMVEIIIDQGTDREITTRISGHHNKDGDTIIEISELLLEMGSHRISFIGYPGIEKAALGWYSFEYLF